MIKSRMRSSNTKWRSTFSNKKDSKTTWPGEVLPMLRLIQRNVHKWSRRKVKSSTLRQTPLEVLPSQLAKSLVKSSNSWPWRRQSSKRCWGGVTTLQLRALMRGWSWGVGMPIRRSTYRARKLARCELKRWMIKRGTRCRHSCSTSTRSR